MNFIGELARCLFELWYLFLGISQSGAFPKRLSAQEERECLERMRNGDSSARTELIEHNLRLVAHIGKKYNVGRSDEEDMLSVGTIGLIKAVDSFDESKGTKFSSYAARCIENECLMCLRSQKKLAQDISISEPIETDKHGNELTLLDIISCEDTIPDLVDLKIKCERLQKVLYVLNERELRIIRLRYGLFGTEPLTQRSIAGMLGISRSYVSRLEKRALEKLREKMDG